MWVVILLILGGLPFCRNGWASPADVPLNDWSYEAVERLAAIGLCSSIGLGIRPYTRDWMAARVAEALTSVGEERIELSPELAYQLEEDLLRLSQEFVLELRQRGVAIGESGEGRRVGEPFHRGSLSFQTELVHQSVLADFSRKNSSSLIENSQGFRLKDGFNGRWQLPSWLSVEEWLAVTFDPSLRVREEDSDADLDFEEASVKLAYRNLELKAGDLNFWWGPGTHGDLLLTNNARPLPAFSLRTREGFELPWKLKLLGKWQAQLIGAQLEEKRDVKNPFLAGTRLEWSPIRRIGLGIAHTALFGGEGEKNGVDDFFNALDPTSGGGETERTDHLFGGDIRIFLSELARWLRLGTGLEIYGEFFGEDTAGFYVPRFTSNLGGFFVTDLFSLPGLDFRLEGAKTDAIAYEHFAYSSGYRYKNEFIGHHAGPDTDDIFVRLTKAFSFED